LPIAALVTRAGVDPRDLRARVDELVAGGDAARAGEVLVAPAIVQQLKQAIVAALAAHHRAQTLSEGVPREELREQVFGRGHAAVFDAVLSELAAGGTVAVRDRVALTTHRVALSPEEERARTSIERAYLEGGLKPPDAASWAAAAGIAPPVADR